LPNFTDELQFRFPWRSYQATFLKNLDKHITDKHLHLIAPPGSGKTILGIEIVRRINKKTLVLAPTLTIRNQWKDRLHTFFTEENSFESVSFDLKIPEAITFSTYQSLHAFFKSFKDKAAFFDFFHHHSIECIVLDEAHHLKNEWWKCLMALKEDRLLTVVALTATPPYDSEQKEIARYFRLCGPVDEEIAVPDLVKEGDLCPHQDYVYFSKPDEATIEAIVAYRKKIANFIDEMRSNLNFLNFLQSHRFYEDTFSAFDEIYSNPEYFSSILLFLNASGVKIPSSKLRVLGFKNEKVEFPALDYQWIETLFQNLLIRDRDNLSNKEPFLQNLETRLRKLSIIEAGKINLVGNNSLYSSLANSPAKMRSIIEICTAEYENLGDSLRCVILTDYIRKEFLKTPDCGLQQINRLGVVPVFRYLRALFPHKAYLGVLSGSLVILHKSALTVEINKATFSMNFNVARWKIDEDFLIVSAKNSGKTRLTAMVTRLFEAGAIKILVGTKSFLGEGWDAPSINSLILASFVGSFVTSNQMRGRAIRSQKGNENKTGIIWHLASIDPTVEDGGKDLVQLKRRFDAFVGISEAEPTIIENGFDRLELPETFKGDVIAGLNKATFKKAINRQRITAKWIQAINKGSVMARELKVLPQGVNPYKKQMKLYYRDAVVYMAVELLIGISLFLPEFFIKNFKLLMEKGLLNFIYIFLVALGLGFGKKLFVTLAHLIKYGTMHKKIDKICRAILATLTDMGHISTSADLITIHTHKRAKGEVLCIVKGASRLEGELIIRALDEALGKIKNPRYLLIVKSWWRKLLKIEQLYAVPDIFGDRKENSLLFQYHWRRNLGKANVVFTRNPEGRKLLVKARIAHISNIFKKENRKAVIWR
jgi:superfamily II DNA or RNA helicase